MEKGSMALKIAAFVVLFLALSCLAYASSETSNSDKKIDADLLNVEGDTPVIIEFSKKPGNYKQIIKSLGGNIVYDYDLIDAVAVRLEGKNIPQLTKLENLVRVHKNRKFKALLNDSVPLISADSVWAEGYTGKDVKVCIVDSGIDYTHQALGACSIYSIHGNTEPYYNESPHIGCNNLNLWYNITKPGFTNISIHFVNISTESNYDFLYIRDANDKIIQTFTGTYKDVWTVSVPGDTIKINLVTDSYGCLYGFYTDKVLNGTVSKGLDNCSKVIAGHDFVNYDDDPMDDDGHGTHVAGIISSDNQNYRGVANGTKLMAAKVLDAYGNGYESDVIAGIQWCKDNGAKIISMSLGGGEYPGTCDSDTVAQAVNNAVDNGIVVVVASGNSGLSGVTTPACASKALAVGATDKNKNVVGYSSKGPELDIVAPGHLIKSTYPGGWVTMSGTSMATPHVSGVVALMLEANPSSSVDNIKTVLSETSDPVNKCYECSWSGTDCTDKYAFEISCDRNVIGSGIVNASRAVSNVQSGCIIKVQYVNGIPISGADVLIRDGNIIGTTDSFGKVSCDSLNPGSYTIYSMYPSGVSQFGPDVPLNAPENAVIPGCVNDQDCNDNNDCTIDACYSPGQYDNHCEYSKPDGTDCGTCCSCLLGNKNYDGTQNSDCDDGLWCNGQESCKSLFTCQSGTSVGCSSHNIPGITTCDWIPDAYHPTWDLRNPFTSQCNEATDSCTTGNDAINHTCSKSKCGAKCEKDSDCSIGICRADCTCGIWESIYSISGNYPVVDIEEYDGKLYFASNNVLYVFNGSTWSTVQAPTNTLTLQNYTNKLYAAGSGGKIYSYDGAWNEVFNTNSQYAKMLGVYNGKLYAGTYLAKPAKLYYFDGTWHEDTNFSSVLNCAGAFCSIDSFANYSNKLYVTSGNNVYVYNGGWSLFKNYTDVYSFQDMKVFNGKLYLATRDQSTRCPLYAGGSGFCGRVIEYNGTNWTTRFDYSYPKYTNGYWMYSLEVYNGRLYAGTANKIYMSSDGGNWESSYNSTSGAEYALALKAWNKKIYVGFGNGIVAKDDMLEPLNVKLLSPTNTTYTTSSVSLTFTVNRPASWIGYNLDGKSNITLTGNTTLTGLTNGGHNIIIYANETIGKMSSSEKIYFKVSVPTCICTPWILDDTGCCKIRTCTPKGCSSEKSCSKYCII